MAKKNDIPLFCIRLIEQLHTDAFPIMSEPRRTGDGYYESVVLDPEGNRLEITV